jgi:hypothetical protein
LRIASNGRLDKFGERFKQAGLPLDRRLATAAGPADTYRANQNFVIITRNGEDNRADILTFVQPDDIIRVLERSLF